ncbi:MAG TPA: DoxX family protein [Polyangiaceae bacterium]|jgi:putative oxidoreductase|nr:DoxX family protein [Polyangiaceae bacterium]
MRAATILRNLCISPLPLPAAWCALPLRAILGMGFFSHGYAKLSRGPEQFIAILHHMGIPLAGVLGWATAVVEIAGGILIALGAFVPAVTVPLTAVLLTAIVTVHLPYGFSSINLVSYDVAGAHFGPVGYEVDLLYVAGLLSLCIAGAGPLSLDSWLNARRRRSDGLPRAHRTSSSQPQLPVAAGPLGRRSCP